MEDDDDVQTIELGNRPLFTQMDVLVHFSGNIVGWKQVARSACFPFQLMRSARCLITTFTEIK